jgi:EmrB/QacA subfamily drug resistance transporter
VTTKSMQRWVLALTAAAALMVALDQLVVATALNSIRDDLHASLATLDWTVNSYSLSFAVLLITGAALGDRYGRRRLFVAGLALFSAASAACALAPNTATLIVARTVQGAGSALVMPLAVALLTAAYPAERRGPIVGIFTALTGLAVVGGPVVGGAVTQGISWQWIFWINVPVVLLAIPLVLSRMDEAFGARERIDLPGAVLVSMSGLGIVWALVRSTTNGWGSAQVLAPLVLGASLAVVFVAVESRSHAPMLPMRLFRSRAFSAGNAVIFLLNAALTGAVFFTAQFLEVAQSHSPLAAGLRLLPWGVTPFLIAPRAGVLVDRFGGRPLIVGGLVLQSIGTGWLATIATPSVSYLEFALAMTVAGVGFSLALPAVTRTVVGSVAPVDMGKASGSFSMLRQFGGAFGVAILAAAFTDAGGYATPSNFGDGYRAAMAVAAVLSVVGVGAALALGERARALELAPEPRT